MTSVDRLQSCLIAMKKILFYSLCVLFIFRLVDCVLQDIKSFKSWFL
jgi:hypothetical protein